MNKKISLKNVSTHAPDGMTKEKASGELEKMKAEIIELQDQFYADGRHSLLIVLQGMDASGKDGTVLSCTWMSESFRDPCTFMEKASRRGDKHDYL